MVSTATAWRDHALTDLVAPDVDAAFFAVIESVPPGRHFTVNDIRMRLDAIEVPLTRRGALFNAAVVAGLIEPLRVKSWGRYYDVRVPSTGATAKAATVRVYKRLGDDLPVKGGDDQ